MARILIVEDEYAISELIKINLNMAGYETCQAMDGEQALELIISEKFDLVLLDIMLPKISGYDLIPHIIEKDIPIIILTAKGQVPDKVKGLNMGAEDYMTKPFEGIELIARVKVVLRRQGKEKSEKEFQNIRVDYQKRKVYKGENEIELTMKEFDLLKILLENEGIALSRENLLEYVWGFDYMGNTRTIDMHIKNLRSKLGTDKIKTVYKIGYMFEI